MRECAAVILAAAGALVTALGVALIYLPAGVIALGVEMICVGAAALGSEGDA